MTIAFRAKSGVGAAQLTALTWNSQPPGHAPNDLYVAALGRKPFGCTVTDPAGYTRQGDVASGTNAPAADAGSTRTSAFTKVHGASESTPTATLSVAPDPSLVGLLAFTKDAAKLWDVAATTGVCTNTSGTAVNIPGAAALSWQPGDWGLVITTYRSNDVSLATPTLTASGITFGAGTERFSVTTTSIGSDLALTAHTFAVTAGTGTAAPTFAGTLSLAHAADSCSVILRLRESDPPAGGSEVWNDTAWKAGLAEVWNGTSWRTDAEVWNGTSWVAL